MVKLLKAHVNWIFVIFYFAAVGIAKTLGGGWWYLLGILPIVWIIDAKGRNQNWFLVGAIPILGFVILLLLENKKSEVQEKVGGD